MSKAWAVLVCYLVLAIPVFYVMITLLGDGDYRGMLILPAFITSAVRAMLVIKKAEENPDVG